jgi:hypothetical protein
LLLQSVLIVKTIGNTGGTAELVHLLGSSSSKKMVGTKSIDPVEETAADPAPIGGVLAEDDDDCEEGHLTADGAVDPADAKVNVRHIPDEPEVCPFDFL